MNCPGCYKEHSNAKFCSKSCAAKINNSLYPKRSARKALCGNCQCRFEARQHQKYCSTECFNQHRYKKEIHEWLTNPQSRKTINESIRRHIFEKNDSKCQECGWSKVNPTSDSIPLEIHHVDGNRRNNQPDNLQLLCPNCHSLTNNYRNLH